MMNTEDPFGGWGGDAFGADPFAQTQNDTDADFGFDNGVGFGFDDADVNVDIVGSVPDTKQSASGASSNSMAAWGVDEVSLFVRTMANGEHADCASVFSSKSIDGATLLGFSSVNDLQPIVPDISARYDIWDALTECKKGNVPSIRSLLKKAKELKAQQIAKIDNSERNESKEEAKVHIIYKRPKDDDAISNLKCGNAAVFVMGISDYDELKNLKGVETDIANYRSLLSDVYNYVVYPEKDDDEYGKRRWTKAEIIEFFENYREVLFEDGELVYDSLIVVICGHGADGAILPSDYKKSDPKTVSISTLHAKVGGLWNPKAVTMPRLFLMDKCRGSLRGGRVNRAAPGGHCADLLYTIYGNSRGIVMKENKKGCFFSQVFVEAMESNVKAGKPLLHLQLKMKALLKKKTGDDQLTVGEGDPAVQTVVFARNSEERGRGAGGRANKSTGNGQRRFKCEICEKPCDSTAALKTHMKRKHKNV